MNKYIVDTSLVMKWILLTEKEWVKEAAKIQEDLFLGKVELIAPVFLLFELGNILYKKYHTSEEELKNALDRITQSGIRFIEFAPEIITSVVSIAVKYKLTFYDAKYVYLAQTKKCKLISCDKKLADLPGIRIWPDAYK